MATIVTRAGKGTTLSWAEMDANLTNLNNAISYSVKDSVYGAKGDGVTDDSAAINAAILAASTSGGTVYVPAGTYIIGSSIILRSNVAIVGDGFNATIFKLKNGANTDVMKTLTNVDTYIGTGTVGTQSVPIGNGNITLRDFQINGNKANNSSGRGLACYWYKSVMERVSILNCKSYGIYEGWGSFGAPDPLRTNENSYNEVTVTQCDGTDSWYHDGPHDSKFNGCIVNNGTGQSYFHTGPLGTGVMMTNCHCWGVLGTSTADWSVIFDGNTAMWCNSTAEGGDVGQIKIRTSDVSIIGGAQYCINPGTYATKGIQIGDTANGFTGIGGYRILTKLNGFVNGAIIFDSDGGSGYIDVIGYNSVAATTVVGSPAASTYTRIVLSGPGAGSLHQDPQALSLKSTVAISGNTTLGSGTIDSTTRVKVITDRASQTYGMAVHTYNGVSHENALYTKFDGTNQLLGNFNNFPLVFMANDAEVMRIDGAGNIRMCGTAGAAIATNATDKFIYVPSCAGTPTGVPTNLGAGAIPMVVDTTNSKLYFRIGGTWKSTTLA